nr:hypothetical protein [Tanacetum cinerariifolium]
MLKGLDKQLKRKEDGGLYLAERIWVRVYGNLRTLIMNKAHATRYSVHPGADKMYYDLRGLYLWPEMKKDITMYVIREDYKIEELARLYINEIIARHHVPVSIISNRDKSFGNTTGSEYRLPSQNRWPNDYDCEIRYHPGKANVVADALSKKEQAKPRRVRSMSMTIHSSIKAKILEAKTEASKNTSTPTEMLKGLDKQLERKEDGGLYLAEQIRVPNYGNMRTFIMNEDHATRLKVARDRQKSYSDKRRKPLEFSVGDKVLLKVSPRKGVVRFVHDTFHVSNLKKCLADVNLHIPLDEVKVDDKLHFAEEPIEILDRGVRKLKRR